MPGMSDAERKRLEKAMQRVQNRLNRMEKFEAQLQKKHGKPQAAPKKKAKAAAKKSPRYLGKTNTGTVRLLEKVDH
jgi:DNA-binding protein H-NS